MIKNYKKVVVEVSMDPKTFDLVKKLESSPVVENADSIHFINVFNDGQKKHLPFNSEDCNNFEKVEDHIMSKLNELKQGMNLEHEENAKCRVFFGKDSKIIALDYLKDIGADLVIVASHGENVLAGLANETFSTFLADHSPADVYIIKPQCHE